MSWLLDTNAVSELRIKKINQGFWEWWAPIDQSDAEVFLCAPVIAELMRGALLLDLSSARRQALLRWLSEDIDARFRGRVLPFDLPAARTWSRFAANIPRGRTLPVVDSYIAAIAIHHDLTLVTRNVADMTIFNGLKIHSPWT